MSETFEVLTAEEASADVFLSTSAMSPYQEQLRDYLGSLLRQGCTRLDWCLVALDAGRPVARVALWAPPDRPVPTDVVLIDADWVDASLSAAREALSSAQDLARSLGAEALGHSLDTPPVPPQYQEDEEARARLLRETGYDLLRDGLRWRFVPAASRPTEEPQSLAFRALPDVGDDAFVDAIAATYQGTRDSWIGREIEERGLAGAARADFAAYREMEHLPEWWELAYGEDGSLAGVIMVARNPGMAVIGYVGVVPEHRGHGLSTQLVLRGTQRLVAGGADEIRGDCDRDNVAMARAFERAGYEQFARRRTYRRPLTSAGDG